MTASQSRRAVFLDKDGTLVDDIPFNVDPLLMSFAPGASDALRALAASDFRLIVVSNQSGVELGRFEESALLSVRARLERMFASCDAVLDDFLWCPHAPNEAGAPRCQCRKPRPGLLQAGAHRHDIDLAQSWMVGDILDDVEAGRRAGCRTILLDNGNETEWLPGPWRTPDRLTSNLAEAARTILEAA
jgi:histidinol-phosphate phosphatase family protein